MKHSASKINRNAIKLITTMCAEKQRNVCIGIRTGTGIGIGTGTGSLVYMGMRVWTHDRADD